MSLPVCSFQIITVWIGQGTSNHCPPQPTTPHLLVSLSVINYPGGTLMCEADFVFPRLQWCHMSFFSLAFIAGKLLHLSPLGLTGSRSCSGVSLTAQFPHARQLRLLAEPPMFFQSITTAWCQSVCQCMGLSVYLRACTSLHLLYVHGNKCHPTGVVHIQKHILLNLWIIRRFVYEVLFSFISHRQSFGFNCFSMNMT